VAILYYAHDPMCSWCWAFHPVWQQVKTGLPADIEPRLLIGGLAPDSDVPMPDAMQAHLQQTWLRIAEHVAGTQFNMDFWTHCKPRRSTFPACRAVIVAAGQLENGADRMSYAIQRAYYLQARNPSDDSTLCELAADIGLDETWFAEQLNAPATHAEHERQLQQCYEFGVQGYPSLVYARDDYSRPIGVDYHSAASMLEQLEIAHAA